MGAAQRRTAAATYRREHVIALCTRCAGRISECYELDPVEDGKSCFLCSGPDATLYDFTPKRMLQRTRRSASAGTHADRQAADARRRWA